MILTDNKTKLVQLQAIKQRLYINLEMRIKILVKI